MINIYEKNQQKLKHLMPPCIPSRKDLGEIMGELMQNIQCRKALTYCANYICTGLYSKVILKDFPLLSPSPLITWEQGDITWDGDIGLHCVHLPVCLSARLSIRLH